MLKVAKICTRIALVTMVTMTNNLTDTMFS